MIAGAARSSHTQVVSHDHARLPAWHAVSITGSGVGVTARDAHQLEAVMVCVVPMTLYRTLRCREHWRDRKASFCSQRCPMILYPSAVEGVAVPARTAARAPRGAPAASSRRSAPARRGSGPCAPRAACPAASLRRARASVGRSVGGARASHRTAAKREREGGREG